MNSRLRLGIDLDGVVADFNLGWMQLYNREFGTELAPVAITTWDGMLEHTHFCQMSEFWKWAMRGVEPSIFRHLPLHEGASEALHALARDHDIVIISTKPSWAIHDTFLWLGDNKIPTREVHLLRDKWTVACDVYLDDSPHVLPDLVTRRSASTVCRYVRPWNNPISGALDIANWGQFEDAVAGL